MEDLNNKLKDERLSLEKRFQDKQYWNRIFENLTSQPCIQYDLNEETTTEPQYDDVLVPFTKDIYESLAKTSNHNNFIVLIYLISILNVTLYKYNRYEEIMVGTPAFHNGNEVEKHNNLIALKLKINGQMKFRDILNHVKNSVMEAMKHQDYSLQDIYNNFFNTTEGVPAAFVSFFFDKVHPSMDVVIHKDSQSKLSFVFEGEDVNFKGYLHYDSNVYLKSTMERIANLFNRIMIQVMSDMDILIKDIQLISQEEVQSFLGEKIVPQFPQDKTLHELFELQVDQTPDNIAVVYGSEKLTYRQLDQLANQIAHYLIEQYALKPDTLVGVMMNKDIDLIPIFLGVLKAGGAYVPLNPDYPLNHLQDIINDAKLEIIITKSEFENQQLIVSCSTLQYLLLVGTGSNGVDTGIYKNTIDKNIKVDEYIDTNFVSFENMSNSRIQTISMPNNLAYVIYTSGTTGHSNGVEIEHRNVISFLMDKRLPVQIDSQDIWTMFHSICFDASVWEMYGAMLYGGKLVLVPGHIAKDMNKYLQLLKEERITILTQTPSAFYLLMQKELDHKDANLALRYIIFCGEALNVGLIKPWADRYQSTKLANMYGITETTVHNTFKLLSYEDIELSISNIGKILPSLHGYIMNEDMNLLPSGMIGELYVSGYGLARSYLNNPELTNRRFITNPYNQEERLYKTGDLVRYFSNGDMEYCGRIDHQVKVRGFRVELSQIEYHLHQYPGITHAVVITNKDMADEKYICAYYVADSKITAKELLEFLSTSIAEYMLPSFFAQIDELPINSNGKVNRKALPTLQQLQNSEGLLEPSTDLERLLVEIWCKVLNIEKVGVNQDFFEIGGHSLRAVMLEVEMQKNNIPVEYTDIYNCKTIRNYANYLDSKGYKYANGN
ncbi:non-ribosomal peptide synthetase [Lachnoclostridium phytofermentans]|uniref:non-ribosomal peptide synthetase n=1 Tax=Lachnoclostridium phytofermentans TaxID=66219 RepID=UPI00068D2106|nr:non-ribosomal peptide synthetase [Lachnoclostridium phytofermentans]